MSRKVKFWVLFFPVSPHMMHTGQKHRWAESSTFARVLDSIFLPSALADLLISRADDTVSLLAPGTFFLCDTHEQYFSVQLIAFLEEKTHQTLKCKTQNP